ncbi:MAG: FAD-dependent oxidoreductase [Bacteroidota bacterium]
MLDYLVVGLGLAGVSFCETLENNNKSFVVVTDHSQVASMVAGGLYNPVLLKRFTLAWNAKEQLRIAMPFYAGLEKKLDVPLDHKVPILRRFASIAEQNLWFEAADKPELQPFLSTQIISNTNMAVDAPYGYGRVLGTGRVDTEKLVAVYAAYLLAKNVLIKKTFVVNDLEIRDDGIRYNSVRARHIVFTDGYGLKNNPYFNYLPLNGTKGELLTIKAPDLKEKSVLKSAVFCIPLGDDLYRVGATYKWKDKTNIPTAEARSELLQKLDALITCDYEVVDHVAGIRPTVTDRRPLVGRHPENDAMYVLNGFGSRGVMTAPFASHQLYQYIENKGQLHQEMDITRFTVKYFKK